MLIVQHVFQDIYWDKTWITFQTVLPYKKMSCNKVLIASSKIHYTELYGRSDVTNCFKAKNRPLFSNVHNECSLRKRFKCFVHRKTVSLLQFWYSINPLKAFNCPYISTKFKTRDGTFLGNTRTRLSREKVWKRYVTHVHKTRSSTTLPWYCDTWPLNIRCFFPIFIIFV